MRIHTTTGVMRGLCLNSTVVRPCCLVRNDALEFLSHNGKSRGQTAIRFSSRRISRYIESGKRLSLRSRNFDPLCIKNKFPKCSEKRICCRVYGSPPDIPVKEVHVPDEEDDEEKPEVVSDSPETTSQEVEGSITSWGDLPPRFRLILTTALAFVICNMDKVSCHFRSYGNVSHFRSYVNVSQEFFSLTERKFAWFRHAKLATTFYLSMVCLLELYMCGQQILCAIHHDVGKGLENGCSNFYSFIHILRQYVRITSFLLPTMK